MKITGDSIACKVTQLDEDLYLLKEVDLINIYLLIGKEKAMLIDTGYGYTDYRPLIRQITQLPLIVVNTHGDPDHALGSYLFDEVYLCEKDYPALVASNNPDMKMTSIKFRYSVLPEVEGMIDEEAYLKTDFSNTKFSFISEGDTFNLGDGQIVEVYELPGHSNGSVGLLDKKNRRFFTGDIITYHNIWNFGDPSRASFSKMMKTYRKAKALQSEYDRVYPAHNITPLPVTVVDELIECIYDIREHHGDEKLLDNDLSNYLYSGKKYMHYYKHVLIIYSDASFQQMLEDGLED